MFLLLHTLSVRLHDHHHRLGHIFTPCTRPNGSTLPSFHAHVLRHHSALGLCHINFGYTCHAEQAKAVLFSWLDGETSIVSLQFPSLLDDDSPPCMPLPATPMRNRLLSTPSQPHASVIAVSACSNADSSYVHTYGRYSVPKTYDPLHLIILVALSRPLIDASITISMLMYAVFRPTSTL